MKMKFYLLLICISMFGILTGCKTKVVQSKPFNISLSEQFDQPIILGGEANLNQPAGIAVDTDGQIWVADSGNNRIVVMNSLGEVIKTIGQIGNGELEFISPTELIYSEDKVYILDAGNYRIQILNDQGDFIKMIKLTDQLVYNDIAINSNKDLFVSTYMPTPKKAKVVKISGEQVKTVDDNILGFLSSGAKESVFFMNTLEYSKEEKKFLSQKSHQYNIHKKASKEFTLPDKYVPLDFYYSNGIFYVINASFVTIDRFDINGNYIDTIFKGDFYTDKFSYITEDGQAVYVTVSSKNVIYKLSRRG